MEQKVQKKFSLCHIKLTCPWHSVLVATKGTSATLSPKTRIMPADTTLELHNQFRTTVTNTNTWSNSYLKSQGGKKQLLRALKNTNTYLTDKIAQNIPPNSWSLTFLLHEQLNKEPKLLTWKFHVIHSNTNKQEQITDKQEQIRKRMSMLTHKPWQE